MIHATVTVCGYIIALAVFIFWQFDKNSYKAKWKAFLRNKQLQEKQIIDSLKAVCDTHSVKPVRNPVKYTQFIGSNRFN